MKKLSQKLGELFQTSDGLLLPDESTLDEISIKQQEIEVFGEELVHQGFIGMRDYLRGLASQNETIMTLFSGRMNTLIDKVEMQLITHYASINDKPEKEIMLSFLI